MTSEGMVKPAAKRPEIHQPIAVVIFHSLNIFAVLLMAGSGLQIYNANPVFGGRSGFQIPELFCLGGWLAGGRHWHFAAMWLFALNMLFYVGYVIWKKRYRKRYVSTADAHAILHPDNPKRAIYAWHRLVYSAILPVLLFALVTGPAMFKPAQLGSLVQSLGGWDSLRVFHFATVPLLVVFVILHSILAFRSGGIALVRSMFRC
jgi:thiosulfate reductase cytochrome b subunit